MEGDGRSSPRWAERLNELCRTNQDSRATTPSSLRQEIWQIVSLALSRYLRYHAARLGVSGPEDLADIASQKSLELLGKPDTSNERLANLAPREIPGFLSTVARNGLVDLLKARGRSAPPLDDDDASVEDGLAYVKSKTDRPDEPLERNEFAQALRQCAEVLEARTRLVWFFRVFYDMPSKEIAMHPRVQLKASHVDVLLQRGREAIRDCMKKRGYEPHEIPAGTFVELWRVFRPLEAETSKETS
jgi:RNA polymerase sigma factor (sigma-70 family)